MRISLENLRKAVKGSPVEKLNPGLLEDLPPEKKKSRYGNTPTEVDGRKFDSIKEANRYKKVLKPLLKTGKIGLLEFQVPYELNPGGTYSYKYIADFRYIDSETGETIVEDVKGFRKVEYKKKCKLMKKVYGITIKET